MSEVDYSKLGAAVATIVLAIVAAKLVDRALVKRGRRLGEAVAGDLSPVVATRLRLVRRLVFAVIVLIGFAIALQYLEPVRRIATGILASSAVLGIVVGFAARQTLANAVAGILIAITQPIRIGDHVRFEEDEGVVEDVRLTYTYLRAGDGRRIVIPNERLAQSTIENWTIVDPRVHVEVSLWLPPGADATRALEVIASEPELDVQVAEVERDGIRLSVGTWAESPAVRGAVAARVRARCLERLRAEGLSSQPQS
jgi:small-conductance mechanosensitive channel